MRRLIAMSNPIGITRDPPEPEPMPANPQALAAEWRRAAAEWQAQGRMNDADVALVCAEYLEQAAASWLLVVPTPREVLAHQIAVVTGLTLAQSLQTLQALAESTHLPRFLAIYHGCQPEGEYILTGTRSYGTGFPELPFTCPNCGEDVTSLDRLRFDVLLRLDEPVLIMPDNARDHH